MINYQNVHTNDKDFGMHVDEDGVESADKQSNEASDEFQY